MTLKSPNAMAGAGVASIHEPTASAVWISTADVGRSEVVGLAAVTPWMSVSTTTSALRGANVTLVVLLFLLVVNPATAG